MDLNHLYSEHQIALMRAAGSTGHLARTGYLAAADLIGDRIRRYQLLRGAAASSGWPHAAGKPQ